MSVRTDPVDASTDRTGERARPGWLGARGVTLTPRRETLLVTAVYVLFAVFLTWPLAIHLGSVLSGTGISGDSGGGVGDVAYIVQHHVFPFAPAILQGQNAPEGIAQPWVLNIASLPSNVPLFGLSYIFGALAGSNLFTLLSFVVTGWSMFLLTRRLYGSALAAALAGFVFAFYPFAVDKINGHFQYMDGFVLVLGVWRMLELIDRPTARNALLGGAAFAFAMWWTPYFILIGGVGFAVMEVVLLVVGFMRRHSGQAVRLAGLAAVPIVVLFAALGLLTAFAGGTATGTVRTQDISQLYAYSARWLEWVLPDRNNLIFGGATGPYLTTHLHGSNFSESSLYLGVSVIVLAIAGAALAARRIWIDRRAAWGNIGVVAALCGAVLALVAALFSAPPSVHILGVWVDMPSHFVFKITSTWRVYTRFVELIELGLCIPLAYAVARVLKGRSPGLRTGIFAALAVIVVLDLWARPPVRTVSAAPPPAYVWLRDHPGGIVADYPLYPAIFPDYAPLFYQAYDHHPLFQGYDANSYDESMKLGLADLANPTTAGELAALDVRYVLTRPGVPGADPTNMRKQHYILRFAGTDGSAVWEVGAAPAPTRVDALSGFWTVEGGAGSEYRWMNGPGVLGAYARNCNSCRGEVTFDSNSNQFPRDLTVRDQRTGAVLLRQTIAPGKTVRVVIPNVQLVHGSAQLLLSTDPPATVPTDGDVRTLSIVVGQPHLTVGSGGGQSG